MISKQAMNDFLTRMRDMLFPMNEDGSRSVPILFWGLVSTAVAQVVILIGFAWPPAHMGGVFVSGLTVVTVTVAAVRVWRYPRANIDPPVQFTRLVGWLKRFRSPTE